MSGSEGDRFVVEIQERVVMRLPLLMPASLELERAGDPEIARVEADDLVAGVKDAPVARPRTPERDRFDVPSWCYTITGRRHGVPVTLINRRGRQRVTRADTLQVIMCGRGVGKRKGAGQASAFSVRKPSDP